ncbi:MAG: dihydrodipicolinate synthase family protein [Candidatus Atribacteria bacterium]|nr:dihydrodipicolinate synthase family protein [Candidatus Atribacteria bacterium]
MKPQGIIVPMVTPLDETGTTVQLNQVENLVRFLIQKKVNALFVTGTTGEGPLISYEEKKEIFRAVHQVNEGQLSLIAQVGSLTTQETIKTAEAALDNGFEYIAVLPPFYFKYNDDALYQYYQTVAKAISPNPIFLYNIPSTTNHFLSIQLVQKIKDTLSNVKGIKDSSGIMSHLSQLIAMQDDNFSVYIGSDILSFSCFLLGAKGMVSGPAGVIPEIYVSFYQAIQAGNLEAAGSLYRKIAQISRMFKDGSDLSLFKIALQMRGLMVGGVRPPLVECSQNDKDRFIKEFKAFVEINNI